MMHFTTMNYCLAEQQHLIKYFSMQLFAMFNNSWSALHGIKVRNTLEYDNK